MSTKHTNVECAVTWAQRSSTTEPEKNHIYMTIVVPDVDSKNLKLDLQSSSLEYTGYSESKKATYHVKMDLFAEIDPKESKINHSSRWTELVLQKKELNEEYWPRLLKDKQKVHYIKTNFDKVRNITHQLSMDCADFRSLVGR